MTKTRMAWAAAALLAALACAGPARGADVAQKAQALLETRDVNVQYALYGELAGTVGPKDLAVLVRVLQGAKAGQNVAFLFLLLEIADGERLVPPLRALLAHPVLEVRILAAQHLGRHGDVSWAPEFLKSIADRALPPEDRQAMVRAFGFPGQTETTARALRLVRDLHEADPPDPAADDIGACILRLFASGPWAPFAQAFRDALAFGGPRTKSAAATALVRQGDPAGLEWILEAYRSGRKGDGELLADLVYLWGIRGKKLNELLVLALEKSRYRPLTLKAIVLLGESRDPGVLDLLKAHIDDADGEVAEAAAAALGMCGGESLIPFWTERLGNRDPRQRVRAAAPLLAMDRPEGLSVLLEILRDSTLETTVRVEAALALSTRSQREVVEPLMDRLADPVMEVRRACWFTLAKVFRTLFPYRGPDVFSPDLIRHGRLFEPTRFVAASVPPVTPEKVKALREYWTAHR